MNHNYNSTEKQSLWKSENTISNVPFWVYSDNPEPTSVQECEAKISSLEFTLKDIDLQIELRTLEMSFGSSRHATQRDFEQWHIKVLKAKQTHLYTLNAYKYWLILHKDQNTSTNLELKVNKLIKLLVEEPSDLFDKLEKLL